MRRCSRVDNQRFRIPHVRQITSQLQAIHNLGRNLCILSLHSETQNTTKRVSSEELHSGWVRFVSLKSEVGYP